MDYPVHPAAAIYPMLPESELQELAASIKARGLYHPIELTEWIEIRQIEDRKVERVVTGIIDGRNRAAACEIAGVKPQYETIDFKRDDTEIRIYIYEINRHRRSLNAGQLAMSVAMIFPEGGEGGSYENKGVPEALRGAENRKGTKRGAAAAPLSAAPYSNRRLQQARQILRKAPDLAKAVMAGNMQFDKALEMVHDKQLEEEREAGKKQKEMDKLWAHAPGLAKEVEDGQTELEIAVVEVNKLIAQTKQKCIGIFGVMDELVGVIGTFANSEEIDNIPGWLEKPEYLAEFKKKFRNGVPDFLKQIDEEKIDTAVERIKELLAVLRDDGVVRAAIRVVE